MEIYAKSALGEIIEVKNRIGCDGVEIQLLNELVETNNNKIRIKKLEDVFNISEILNNPIYKNIKVIHCPLMKINNNNVDLNIESMIYSEEADKLINYSCQIANSIGKKFNRDILVVVHSELNNFYKEFSENLVQILINKIECILKKYPFIQIGIENITPLRNAYGENVHLANNYKFDNVKFVKLIREKLNTNRIGTVLDTCHCKITEMLMNKIYEYINSGKNSEKIYTEDYSLENYIKTNKDVIKLIHLSDLKNNGYGKYNHGIPFTESEESISKIKEFIKLYNKYEYTCPVTLEISEIDYSKCEGFELNIKLLKNYI